MELQEGNIYRWSYLEPGDDRTWGRYHCCSCIAIVERGRLRDTYWDHGGSDGRSFGVEDLPKLELALLGNLSDLEKTPEWKGDYYDDADIVNINHSNSSRDNFYLRKGAKRSAKKMLETARRKFEKAESDIRAATARAAEARTAIGLIEAGQTEIHI